MSRKRVLCIGETMAMVTSTTIVSLAESDTYTITAGGAESNVAGHLAAMGFDTAWLGRLGDDALGDRIYKALDARGIDLGWVARDSAASTGVYFKDPIPRTRSAVSYYRSTSAATRMSVADLARWPLPEARWVHTTGITAGLSDSCDELVEEVLHRSTDLGYGVSFDINYRPALWPNRDAAARRMLELGRSCQVLLVGLDEAQELWAVDGADDVADLFSTVRSVVVKDGAHEAVEFLHTDRGREIVRAPARRVDVVEAVGAGDAFAAAFLAGYLADRNPVDRLTAGHELAAWTLGVLDDYRPAPTPSAPESGTDE